MRVILISGKAQHGKDTTALILQELLEDRGESVLIAHYGDLVKYICTKFFNWDGVKDEPGRTLLQYVGTDIIRKKNPDFWVSFVVDILEFFPNEWGYVLIPDVRFPNEIDVVKRCFDCKHLRIHRPDFNSGLTEEQLMHPSETALDSVVPDVLIQNKGSLDDLREELKFRFTEIYK